MAISQRLARRVRERAQYRCEYCQLPEAYSSLPFEIDHIVAEQHEGRTVLGNLALACFADNHYKGPNLAGVDPQTGRKTWLSHPRRQSWKQHFRWSGAVLVGRTAAGRATIAALRINAPHRVAQRAELLAEGVFHSE
jgi:hypothetical protein